MVSNKRNRNALLRNLIFGLGASLLISATSQADENSRGGKKHGRHGPPAEAVEACADLAVGDACQFESPRREEVISGICFTPPHDESLVACRPENRPRRGDRSERGEGDTSGV